MAASIAHEINNPLDAIKNIFYLLEQSATEDQAAQVKAGAQELKHVSEIIRRTLSFARSTPAQAQIDLPALIDESLELLDRRIQQKNAVVHKSYRAIRRFTGGPGELRQVFVNLIDNALDAIDQNGEIRLRVRETGGRNGKQSVAVVITDNGRGIPAEVRCQLFQPLFTTKGEEGTGLGLWIIREILQKHGAHIQVRSRNSGPRRGTCFRIIIPVSSPPLA
jgi:signal transduction histidine kinase